MEKNHNPELPRTIDCKDRVILPRNESSARYCHSSSSVGTVKHKAYPNVYINRSNGQNTWEYCCLKVPLFLVLIPFKGACVIRLFLNPFTCGKWGRDGVVGVATPQVLRIPVGGEIFRNRPHRTWGRTSLLYNGYRVILRIKRPECGVNHPAPSSSRVKERVELYLYSPFCAFVAR